MAPASPKTALLKQRFKLAAQYQSRKLWFAVFAMIVILLAGAFIAVFPGLAALYDTLVSGIVGIAGLYMVGNVGAKFVGGKAPAPQPAAPPPPAPEAEGPPIEGGPG